MLPKEILEVIKKHEIRICNDIPTNDILLDLKVNEVLSDQDIFIINKFDENIYKNLQLIKILKSRGTKDFSIFCTALKKLDIRNVKELGALLETDANEATNSRGIINNTNV